MICFVSQSPKRTAGIRSCDAVAAGSEEKSAASPENVAEVFSLRGENPADTLFLHASVADGIAAPYPNVQTDRLQTRATPVETGTFYDSFGVLASVYTGTWSEDSCLPDYMYDVEVTEASSWTTSYYWPGAGRNIRFFAYAPYGGQGIVLSDKTSAGTPSITYTVPTAVADQQDLLNFVGRMRDKPRQIRLVHGDVGAKAALAAAIRVQHPGIEVVVP